MTLADLWDWLESKVFPLPSLQGKRPLFNFYNQDLEQVDCPGGSAIRRTNLRNYLASFPERPTTLILGEAPGWRGCRFSGVPFSSEALLVEGLLPFRGEASSLAPHPLDERTADQFWRALRRFHPQFIIWNCLPLHPHLPDQPLTNRSPIYKEVLTFAPLLIELLDILKPKKVIAVGRNAQIVLRQNGVDALAVRHPSHGGARIFHRQIREILEL